MLNEKQRKHLTEILGETQKERDMRLSRLRAKKWRDNNEEKHVDYTRKWRAEHKQETKEHSKKYRLKNMEKTHAHRTIYKAVVAGRVEKPDCCKLCGLKTEDLHGHHDDYNKRLEVRWLCRKCHCAVHREKEKICCLSNNINYCTI
jgi:hypothetical protein